MYIVYSSIHIWKIIKFNFLKIEVLNEKMLFLLPDLFFYVFESSRMRLYHQLSDTIYKKISFIYIVILYFSLQKEFLRHRQEILRFFKFWHFIIHYRTKNFEKAAIPWFKDSFTKTLTYMDVRNRTKLPLESSQIKYGFLIVTGERDHDSVILGIESNAVDATQYPCRLN